MKNFLDVIIVLLLGLLVGHNLMKHAPTISFSKNNNLETELSMLKEKVSKMEIEKEMQEKYSKQKESELNLSANDKKELKEANELLNKKLQELITENNKIVSLNEEASRKLEQLLENQNSLLENKNWLDTKLTSLEEKCGPKKEVKKAKRKTKIQDWNCKDKVGHNKCMMETNAQWENLCRNTPKFLTVNETMKHTSKHRKYDLDENTLVNERVHTTELVPPHKVLNPNYPEFCNKGKLDLVRECNAKYCH